MDTLNIMEFVIVSCGLPPKPLRISMEGEVAWCLRKNPNKKRLDGWAGGRDGGWGFNSLDRLKFTALKQKAHWRFRLELTVGEGLFGFYL